MPKIPVYEQQASVRAPSVSTPSLSGPVQGAFGADVAEANQRLGATMQKAGEVFANHMIELEVKKNEKAVLDANTAYSREAQGILYSKDADDKGRPTGVMLRSLEHADGATSDYDQKMQALKGKYLGVVQNQAQKDALSKLMNQHDVSLRGSVISHEAEQGRASFKNSLESNMKQRTLDAALIKDPALLSQNVATALSDYETGLRRMGTDQATIDLNKKIQASDMVKSAFMPVIEKDYKQAQAMLNNSMAHLPKSTAEELQKAIDGKAFDDVRVNTWTQLSGLKLADGSMNQDLMQKKIFEMNMTTDKKESLWGYVKARAGEEDHQKRLAEVSGDYAFKNDILGMKEKGAKLDDALKIVANPKYGSSDNVIKSERETIAKKIWSEKTITDPEVYNNLWFAVADGKAGRTEIDRAYQNGQLSASDWQGLGKHWYGTEHKSDDIMMKTAMERIQVLADNNFSSGNKKEKNAFLYDVMQNVKGKTPAELIDYANKSLEKDPNTGFLWFGKKKNFVQNIKTTDAYNQAEAMITKDLGADVTRAILDGKYKGKPGDPIQAVDEFAKEFGGNDKIKPGTTVYKVIEKMKERGWTVTPQTVRDVMNQKGLR